MESETEEHNNLQEDFSLGKTDWFGIVLMSSFQQGLSKYLLVQVLKSVLNTTKWATKLEKLEASKKHSTKKQSQKVRGEVNIQFFSN
jgi:hypothetical protein